MTFLPASGTGKGHSSAQGNLAIGQQEGPKLQGRIVEAVVKL